MIHEQLFCVKSEFRTGYPYIKDIPDLDL